MWHAFLQAACHPLNYIQTLSLSAPAVEARLAPAAPRRSARAAPTCLPCWKGWELVTSCLCGRGAGGVRVRSVSRRLSVRALEGLQAGRLLASCRAGWHSVPPFVNGPHRAYPRNGVCSGSAAAGAAGVCSCCNADLTSIDYARDVPGPITIQHTDATPTAAQASEGLMLQSRKAHAAAEATGQLLPLQRLPAVSITPSLARAVVGLGLHARAPPMQPIKQPTHQLAPSTALGGGRHREGGLCQGEPQLRAAPAAELPIAGSALSPRSAHQRSAELACLHTETLHQAPCMQAPARRASPPRSLPARHPASPAAREDTTALPL